MKHQNRAVEVRQFQLTSGSSCLKRGGEAGVRQQIRDCPLQKITERLIYIQDEQNMDYGVLERDGIILRIDEDVYRHMPLFNPNFDAYVSHT